MFIRFGMLFAFIVPISLGAIIPASNNQPAIEVLPDLHHEALPHTHVENGHHPQVTTSYAHEDENMESSILLETYDGQHHSSQDSGVMESYSWSESEDLGFMYETLEEDPNYATSEGLEHDVEDLSHYETFETLGSDEVEFVGYDRLGDNLEFSHAADEPAVEVETVVLDQDQYTPNEVLVKPETKDCYPVEKTVYQEEMVPYTQQTCITRQQTDCQDIETSKCVAVVDKLEDRNCFNVTETICKMEEIVDYASMSPELEQLCKEVEDSVCDTIYELKRNSKTDYACVELENQKCEQENPYVSDITCVSSFEFSCGGSKAGTCLKTPTKKCYKTPKRIKVDTCKPEKNQRCEKLRSFEDTPVPRQHCHPTTKKVCKLVPRMHKKEKGDEKRKARELKFTYKEECKPLQRQVCGSRGHQRLVPSCTPEIRRVCTHVPSESCTSEQKEYKFKREKLVVEMVCKDKKVEVVEQTVDYV